MSNNNQTNRSILLTSSLGHGVYDPWQILSTTPSTFETWLEAEAYQTDT